MHNCSSLPKERRVPRSFLAVCRAILCLLILATAAYANGSIANSYSGISRQINTGSTLNAPNGIAVAMDGTVYISDTSNNQIYKVLRDGTASVLSISGLSTGLSSPHELAVNDAGILYIADTGNNRIVSVDSTGAGSVVDLGGLTLSSPEGVAIDANGNLFLSDTGANRLIKKPASGAAAVFTPTGTAPSSAPSGLAVDTAGTLYVADTGANRVVKVTAAGVGSAVSTSNSLSGPTAVAVDNNKTLYIADTGNSTIIAVNIAGTSSDYLSNSNISLNSPNALAVNAMGSLYVTAGNEAYYVDRKAVDFGHITLGGTPSTISLPFAVGSATISSIQVFTDGVENLDFTVANSSTCTLSTSSNSTCNLDVSFSPTAPGLRKGSAVVTYALSSSSQTFTVPLYGIADAPVSTLTPGVSSAVATGSTITSIATPFQTATDGAGNMYVVSYTGTKIYKIPANGGDATEVAVNVTNGLSQPTGIAINANGDLMIADYQHQRLVKLDRTGTASEYVISNIPNASASTGIWYPTTLNYDGAGNLYITNYGKGNFIKVSPDGVGTVIDTGSYTFSGSTITGTAVDTNGNFYIADRSSSGAGAGRVIKVSPSGATSILSLAGVTLSNPQGVSVDGLGNIYVVDTNNQRIVRVTTAGVVEPITYSGSAMGGTVFNVAIDATGSLYICDWNNNRVLKVDLTQGSLAFPNTGVNVTSSAKTAKVTNIGNQTLAIPSDPTFPAEFAPVANTAGACAANTSLTPGANCSVPVTFTPAVSGARTGSISVANNNLNTAATQSIAVSGTGVVLAATTTTTIAVNPSVPAYGQPTTITVTVANTAGASSPVPTGTVTVTDTVGGSTTVLSSAAPLVNGVAILSNVVLTGVGSHSIGASYGGVTNSFLSSNATPLNVTVQQATAQVSGNSTASLALGQAGTASVTLTPPYGTTMPTGTLTYSIRAANSTVVVPATTVTLNAGSSSSTGTISIPNTLGAGSYTATVDYSGDTNYAPISGAFTVAITVQQGALQASGNSTVSLTFGQAGTASVVLTPAAQAPRPTGTLTYLIRSGNTTVVPAANVTLSAGATSSTATIPIPNSLAAGTYTAAVAYNGDANYQAAPSAFSVSITVGKATPTITLATSGATVLVSSPVTFTATVNSTVGIPSGSVTFLDGTTALGTAALVSGKASLTTSSLTAATHSITAAYIGSSNFSAATSSAVSQLIQDYTISIGGGSTGGGSSSGSGAEQTVLPGGTASYSLALGPANGTTFPAPVTLSVTGAPPGATATLSPTTLPAGSSLTNVTLTVTLPKTTAENSHDSFSPRKLGPVLLGLLLMPFALRWRRAARSLRGTVCSLLLLFGALLGTAALSGCGSSSGYFGQPEKSYTLTITATSGTVSRSTTVKLNVQ